MSLFKVPARICLYGDHQDYLQLPVIACSIDIFMQLEASPNDKDILHLNTPDINQKCIIRLNENLDNINSKDYLLTAIKVLKRDYDCIPNKGYDITIKSNIPINAGLSSSSALICAWILFLVNTYGCNKPINAELIAKMAYEVEVVESGSPGGKMDQYSICLGNTIYLETGEKPLIKKTKNNIEGLIVGESGIAKPTNELLRSRRTNQMTAIETVIKNFPNFDIHQTTKNDIAKYSTCLPKELQSFFEAAISNYEITRQALKELEKSSVCHAKLGKLMYEHHNILSNKLQVSTPLIDNMVEVAMQAGALGAKIVGSGGGGCMVAISPSGKKQEIVEAIKKTKAKDSYPVKVSSGLNLSNNKTLFYA